MQANLKRAAVENRKRNKKKSQSGHFVFLSALITMTEVICSSKQVDLLSLLPQSRKSEMQRDMHECFIARPNNKQNSMGLSRTPLQSELSPSSMGGNGPENTTKKILGPSIGSQHAPDQEKVERERERKRAREEREREKTHIPILILEPLLRMISALSGPIFT